MGITDGVWQTPDFQKRFSQWDAVVYAVAGCQIVFVLKADMQKSSRSRARPRQVGRTIVLVPQGDDAASP